MDLMGLARELSDEYGVVWVDLEIVEKEWWEDVARKVTIMILDAKIEILKEIMTGPDWTTRDKIAALTAEKEKISHG